MKKMLFLLAGLIAVSCNEKNEIVAPYVARVSLTVQNLPHLESGHYQLWAKFVLFNKQAGGDAPLHDDGYQSLGEFNVRESDGAIVGADGGTVRFALPADRDPQLLTDVAIAVQPPEIVTFKVQHEEVGPILLAGKFHGTAATAAADLSVLHTDALQTQFTALSGRCSITCPTSPADSNNGVWFVNLGPPISPGLQGLPSLPTQWKYEGWVVSGGQAYSTGRFARADSADLDGAGPYRGPGTPINFPGQDFVLGAVRLSLVDTGFTFMVTVEPDPDNSSDPFFVKVLSARSGGRSVTFQNVAANSLPTARVVVER